MPPRRPAARPAGARPRQCRHREGRGREMLLYGIEGASAALGGRCRAGLGIEGVLEAHAPRLHRRVRRGPGRTPTPRSAVDAEGVLAPEVGERSRVGDPAGGPPRRSGRPPRRRRPFHRCPPRRPGSAGPGPAGSGPDADWCADAGPGHGVIHPAQSLDGLGSDTDRAAEIRFQTAGHVQRLCEAVGILGVLALPAPKALLERHDPLRGPLSPRSRAIRSCRAACRSTPRPPARRTA